MRPCFAVCPFPSMMAVTYPPSFIDHPSLGIKLESASLFGPGGGSSACMQGVEGNVRDEKRRTSSHEPAKPRDLPPMMPLARRAAICACTFALIAAKLTVKDKRGGGDMRKLVAHATGPDERPPIHSPPPGAGVLIPPGMGV